MKTSERSHSLRKVARLLALAALFAAGFAAAHLWQFGQRNPRRVEVRGTLQPLIHAKAEPPSTPSPVGSLLPKLPASRPDPQLLIPSRSAPATLYEHLAPSVFEVETVNQKGTVIALGSGVAVGRDEVVTNMHVIQSGTAWRVTQGDTKWPATPTHLDPDHDLCGLRVQGLTTRPVAVRPSSTLRVGEHVYTVGAPLGFASTFSDGLISALREYDGTARLIQTSAPISQGSSGGGLFDAEGRLVGITFAGFVEGQNLNFALPGEWVLALDKHPISEEQVRVVSAVFQALEYFQLGDAAVRAGQYQQAVADYKESIQLGPDFPGPWVNLGLAYNSLERYGEALKTLQQATRLSPSMFEAWLNLGYTYIGLHQPDNAVNVLQNAVRLKRDNEGAWNSLGTAYNDSKRYNDALSAFGEALRLKPEYAEASYGLGNTYSGLMRYSEAVSVYKEAIRLKPDLEFAWINLGNAYRRLQQNEQAIEAYRRATQLKPDDPFAWEHLGATYNVTHDYAQAVSNLQRAIQLKSDWEEPWGDLGYVYLAMQQWDRAVEALIEAARLKPDDASAWFGLGMARAVLGDRTRVREAYDRLQIIDPRKAEEFRQKIMSKMP